MRNAKRNRIKVRARKSTPVASAKVAKTPEERAIALYFQCRAHTAEGNATNSKRNAKTAGKSKSRIPAAGRLPQEPNEGSDRVRRGAPRSVAHETRTTYVTDGTDLSAPTLTVL
jgi:hypothetical protein